MERKCTHLYYCYFNDTFKFSDKNWSIDFFEKCISWHYSCYYGNNRKLMNLNLIKQHAIVSYSQLYQQVCQLSSFLELRKDRQHCIPNNVGNWPICCSHGYHGNIAFHHGYTGKNNSNMNTLQVQVIFHGTLILKTKSV